VSYGATHATYPRGRTIVVPGSKTALLPVSLRVKHDALCCGWQVRTLRKLVQPISAPELLKYLDESIRCAEANCVRGSVVLAWCAVAFKVHEKLVSLGLPQLETEFEKMRLDHGMMFKHFTKVYKVSTNPDVQEIADAHLILLCRFLTYLDDTEYKHLKAALDLRNGCGHPTGYQPDPVKLQAYFADITQLVLLNPKFA